VELAQYLDLLNRWRWVMLSGVLAAAAVTFWIVRQVPATYESTATVLIDLATSRQTAYEDQLLNQQVVATYVQLADTTDVLRETAARLGLQTPPETLQHAVRVRPTGAGTSLFTITGIAATPTDAQQLANTLANVFVEQQTARLGANAAAGSLSVVQPARTPQSWASPC
jgi:capsular polysaccharide biosynthesis protein